MTNVEIANRALAIIGHDRTIQTWNENTTEAIRCRMFYPVALDGALAQFAWEWATRTLVVAANTATTLPADCVRVIDVRDANGNAIPTTRSGNTIKASKAGTLRYVANDTGIDGTSIESVFPSHFADAVVHQLAFLLYGPMLGNPTTKDAVEAQQSFSSLAMAKLETAKNIELEEHAFMGAPGDPDAAAKTDIANRALAFAGSVRLVRNFDEDPCHEAILCRQLFPMALERVLTAYAWEFARTTATAASSPWSLPTDFVSLVSVRDAEGKTLNAKMTGDGKIVFTGTNASVTYVTRDVMLAKMPAAIQQALVSVLSSMLAPTLAAGEGGTERVTTLVKNADLQLAYAKDVELKQASWMLEPNGSAERVKGDIANRALSMLGANVTIKDFANDTNVVAVRARLLMADALDHALRIKDWDFAAREVTLTLTGTDEAGYARVPMPTDAVRIVKVMDVMRHPIETYRDRDFLMVKSNDRKAVFRYVSNDFDLAEAPSDYRDLVATDLAERLAPTVIEDAKAMTALQQKMRVQFGETSMKESNETAFGGNWKNPFIGARE